MSKAKLKAARDLINELNYDAARAILRTMPDDPTAQQWLAKLARIAPEAASAEAGKTAPIPPVRAQPPDSIRQLPPDPALQPRAALTPLPRYEPEPAFPELEQKPSRPAPALRRARRRLLWLRLWQLIWGGLGLLALGWILFGIYGTFTGTHPLSGQIQQAVSGAVNQAAGTVGSQVPVGPEVTETIRGTGDSLSTAASLGLFICSGLPLMLVFLSFYRRTRRILRDERQHKEVLETMQYQQS